MVDVNAGCDQQVEHFQIFTHAGKPQRIVAVDVFRIDAGAGLISSATMTALPSRLARISV